MFFQRAGRRALGWALLTTLALSPAAWAESTTPAPASAAEQLGAPGIDLSTAPYLDISLGAINEGTGLRLIEGMVDGATEAGIQGGRRAVANAAGPNRYFYFDVHDTYIHGGFNRVTMTITYDDLGTGPIDLEYDAYDVVNPTNLDDAWVKRRVSVAVRTNSGGVKTAFVVLEDARFGNNQPGGADFRLVATDDLVLRNLSLMRTWEPTANLPLRVVLDGQEVLFEVPPFIQPETSTTMVPMRRLFNALGVANDQILWDGEARTVTAKKGKTTIVLRIDSDIALVDGMPVRLQQPAIIQDGSTLVPLRFVSESFGLSVQADMQMRLITITSTLPQP